MKNKNYVFPKGIVYQKIKNLISLEISHSKYRYFFSLLFMFLYCQNSAFGQWDTLYLSTPRTQLCACGLGSKIYFAGGKTYGGNGLSDIVDILDVNTGVWTLSHLDKPKRQLECTVVGDKIFFVGNGQDFYNSGVMDVYDETNDVWSIELIPNARGGRITSNLSLIHI